MLVLIFPLPCLQICGPQQCSRYTNCITCLYRIVDGVFQETGEESCQSICDAVNAIVMADTISGPNDPRINGSLTCIIVVDGQFSGILFYVNVNVDGTVDILVSNSLAGECTCADVQSCIMYWHFHKHACMGVQLGSLHLCAWSLMVAVIACF